MNSFWFVPQKLDHLFDWSIDNANSKVSIESRIDLLMEAHKTYKMQLCVDYHAFRTLSKTDKLDFTKSVRTRFLQSISQKKTCSVDTLFQYTVVRLWNDNFKKNHRRICFEWSQGTIPFFSWLWYAAGCGNMFRRCAVMQLLLEMWKVKGQTPIYFAANNGYE